MYCWLVGFRSALRFIDTVEVEMSAWKISNECSDLQEVTNDKYSYVLHWSCRIMNTFGSCHLLGTNPNVIVLFVTV